jgi:O-antigen ligase
MSSIPLRSVNPIDPRRTALVVPLGVVLGLGLALTGLALRGSPPATTLLAAGTAFLALLALAVARYDAAVALGFLVFGFVRAEPAPTDAVFAVIIAVALATGRFRLDRVRFASVALIGVYIALSALSIASAVDLSEAIKFFTTSLYLCIFFLWLVGYVDSRRRARFVLGAYLVSALVSAALGSLPFVLSLPGADLFTSEGGFRAQGLFKDPNVFGPFLVPAALILIEEVVTPRLLSLSRLVKLVLISVLLVGLLLSYSRAAWLNFVIGLVVTLAVILLRGGGVRKIKVITTSLVAAVVLLAPLVAVTGATGVIETRTRLQAYDEQRFEAQRAGLVMGETHPIGVGPGQFDLHAVTGAHSLYVRVFAEQGALGLLTLLLFLSFTLAAAASNALVGRDTFGIGSAALLGALCGLLACSAFVDTLHWRHLWMVTALIWAGRARGFRRSTRTAQASRL